MKNLLFLLLFFSLLTACTGQRNTERSNEEARASEPAAATEQDGEQTDSAEHALQAPDAADAVDRQDTDEAGEGPAPGARPWSTEGLMDQPRVRQLAADTPADMGTPGTTDWRPSETPIPDSLTGAYNPAQLLHSYIQEARMVDSLSVDVWEQTLRIHQDDDRRAQGIILTWGIKDDSMAGMDLLITMTADEEIETWQIESVQERFHCRRGVSNGLCS